MTPNELEVCLRVGLVEQHSPGIFVLTWTARKLLGEKPPAPRAESHEEWLERVESITQELSP